VQSKLFFIFVVAPCKF